MAVEQLTSVTISNPTPVSITTLDLLTIAQVNTEPLRIIQTIPFNSNVVSSSLSLVIDEFLEDGPTPELIQNIPDTGLIIPTGALSSLFVIQGFAIVTVTTANTLIAFAANSPTVNYRQLFPGLFPILQTEAVTNGILRKNYYTTIIVSPHRVNDTWTWPAYSVTDRDWETIVDSLL